MLKGVANHLVTDVKLVTNHNSRNQGEVGMAHEIVSQPPFPQMMIGQYELGFQIDLKCFQNIATD